MAEQENNKSNRAPAGAPTNGAQPPRNNNNGGMAVTVTGEESPAEITVETAGTETAREITTTGITEIVIMPRVVPREKKDVRRTASVRMPVGREESTVPRRRITTEIRNTAITVKAERAARRTGDVVVRQRRLSRISARITNGSRRRSGSRSPASIP